MKTTEINIRDPYILVHGGKYYLYGTRSATCWGATNFQNGCFKGWKIKVGGKIDDRAEME